MAHYDNERLDEIEEQQNRIKHRLYLDEKLTKKPKLNRIGEAAFIVALLFIVISLIVLFGPDIK